MYRRHGPIQIGRYRPIGRERRCRGTEEADRDDDMASEVAAYEPAARQLHGFVPLPENKYLRRAAIAKTSTMTASSQSRPMPHIIIPPI